MLRRWRVLTAIVFLVTAMAGCDACKKSPTGPSVFNVTPTSLTMSVGQTSTITTEVRVNGELDIATFTSSNASVATVDFASGLVRCLSPGQSTITVRAGITSTTKTVAVTCTAIVLMEVTPTTVPFTHSVGVTACPQKIGTLHITNQTPGALTVTLSSSSPAVTLDATNVTVPLGGSADVGASFNCSVQNSFTATITVSASTGTMSDTKTVLVQGTVAR